MTHSTDWHREYARLELAESIARVDYRCARSKAKKEAALEVLRAAGAARFDYEMAGSTIVEATARNWRGS